MPEVIVSKARHDKERRKTPRADGETHPKAKAEAKESARQKEAKQRAEGEQRREALERERREAEVSIRKQAEAVKKATEELRRAAQEKAIGTTEVVPKGERPGEEPQIVESPRPLEFLSREQVIETFKSQDVRLTVPDDWDRWNHVKRRIWLEKKQVLETLQFPESDVLYKDDEDKIAVVRDQDGYKVFGAADFEPETVQELLKKADVDVELNQPADWQKRSSEEKQDWYREAGIEVTTAIAVGGARWLDNYIVDEATTANRLRELQAERQADPVNFHNQGWEADVAELQEHLQNLETGRPVEIIQRLMINPNDAGIRASLNYLVDYARVSAAANRNYRFVKNFNETIKDFVDRGANIDQFLPQNVRTAIEGYRNTINTYFRRIEVDKKRDDPEGLENLYRVLEANASSYLRALRSGYFGEAAEAEKRTFETVRQEQYRELPGEQGLLEWRATVQFENMDRSHRTEFERGTPIDWRESRINAKRNLLFIESQDAPPELLQDAISRVVRIADDLTAEIPKLTGQDKEDAEKMLRDINEFKDSVYAIYQFRTAVEGSQMNPEKVLPVFDSPLWKDVTWKYYFKRFAEDHRDRDFVDGQNNKFNLMDKAMSLYFRRFREERLRMNRIEQLTLGELDPNSQDADVRWLVAEMQRRGFALNEWGNSNIEHAMDHTQQAIDEWYRQNTLLGAHGVDANGRDFLDIQRDSLLNELRATLDAMGIPQDRITEYMEAGLLKQVINNAYHLTFSMGAFSDYDLIRVYDRSQEFFEGRRRLARVVQSKDSRRWWGWHVDHFGEFLHFEPRGRAGRFGRTYDTNYILQKYMLGRRRNILPNNRLLTKMINDNLRYVPEIGGQGFSLDMTGGGRTLARQIDDKIRHDLENVHQLDLSDEDEYGFARGWATSELIDEGEVSFENVEWSKILDIDDPNISKFNMGDWWYDRTSSAKCFSPTMMQEYLQSPGTEKFFEVNSIENFYSKREIRLKPWMKLVMPAHFEIGKYWKKWWKLPYNMPHAEKEEMIDYAVQTNRLDSKYHHSMKLRNLGWGFIPGGFTVRRARELAEAAFVITKETGKGGVWLPFLYIFEFFKQALGQMQGQLAGK